MRTFFLFAAAVLLNSVPVLADRVGQNSEMQVLRTHRAKHFHRTLPAGQYSGITHVRDSLFAVVSDEERGYGFFLWRLELDDATGKIKRAENLGFKGEHSEQRFDMEGIAYNPHTNTLLISCEQDHSVVELDMDGRPTGRRGDLPEDVKRNMAPNRSLEALCYDEKNRTVWTANESSLLTDGEVSSATNGQASVCRLFAFDEHLQLQRTLRYRTEPPAKKRKARSYALGVSAMASLGDGRLLVLEREVRVPLRWVGATARVRIFVVNPEATAEGEFVEKRLLLSFKTRLDLLHFNLANYEGLAITPVQSDGSRFLVLVADSQMRYKGMLKDWVKCIKIAPSVR